MREFAENIWIAERPQRFLGFEIGTRMTIIRMGSGALFVHSPIALDGQTRRELAQRGPVRFVIGPNRYHHLYLGDYFVTYPDALFFAAPGLSKKRRELFFHGVLSDEAPRNWAGEIDQVVVRGIPLFNEVVFFHRVSRTLVVTDLVFHICRESPLLTRWFAQLEGVYQRAGFPRLERNRIVRDRKAMRESIDRILSWDFGRVILAHGRMLERDGHAAIEDAFKWL